MAGHSQFKNIMHRKGAQDAKRAKIFTKILREVTVAVRMGGKDPDSNARLRTILMHARFSNVPKENIDRAIGKASQQGVAEESLCYEAFGAGGGALLVEVLSANRNKSASEIRAILSRHGARLADVRYLFHQEGRIIYRHQDADALMECAIAYGATDFKQEEDLFTLSCPREMFFSFCDQLEARFGSPDQAQIGWFASLPHEIHDKETMQSFRTLLYILEDHEDVQHVWTNVIEMQDVNSDLEVE